MTASGSAGRRALAARLAGIGLLAAGVSVALYVAGPLHTPDATSALFGFTVPIAAHCLFTYGVQYGVQLTSPRVAVHSMAGCFFYGAFAAKVLLVHSRRLPGWALPVA